MSRESAETLRPPVKQAPERITYAGVQYVRADIHDEAQRLAMRQAAIIRKLQGVPK